MTGVMSYRACLPKAGEERYLILGKTGLPLFMRKRPFAYFAIVQLPVGAPATRRPRAFGLDGGLR